MLMYHSLVCSDFIFQITITKNISSLRRQDAGVHVARTFPATLTHRHNICMKRGLHDIHDTVGGVRNRFTQVCDNRSSHVRCCLCIVFFRPWDVLDDSSYRTAFDCLCYVVHFRNHRRSTGITGSLQRKHRYWKVALHRCIDSSGGRNVCDVTTVTHCSPT